ncbi:PQ loop repeat-domain-containing protein [Paraphysoderma sedebokerense]|nr:PQ loop repeat-domain-containing protein [Paraphysoderma sedebokerense]
MIFAASVSTGTLISKILGWTYFLAWSISFYPQIILNFKRKSVEGLSLDFLVYNILGFTCYSIYTTSFYFSHTVQEQYQWRNNGESNLVQTNDVVFAVHALVLTIATGVQAWRFKTRRHHPSRVCKAVVSVAFLLAGMILLATAAQLNLPLNTVGKIETLDMVYFCGNLKLLMTFVKYSPQAYLNFRRKSTIGWSIHNIILDFTGGILSLLQLFLDAYLISLGDTDGVAGVDTRDWFRNVIFGNGAKLGLSITSISIDLIFITQHILYRNNAPVSMSHSTAPILEGEEGHEYILVTDEPESYSEYEKHIDVPKDAGPTLLYGDEQMPEETAGDRDLRDEKVHNDHTVI